MTEKRTELKRAGRPPANKGDLICPIRVDIVRRLKTDPQWRAGIHARDLQGAYGVSRVRAQKIMNALVEAGHVDRVLERIAGMCSLHARYYWPGNKAYAVEASAVSTYEARKRAGEVQRRRDKRQWARRSGGAVEDLPPVPLPKPKPARYVGEVVQCRAQVWARPFEPAGFEKAGIGCYLPGESWAARAFGA